MSLQAATSKNDTVSLKSLLLSLLGIAGVIISYFVMQNLEEIKTNQAENNKLLQQIVTEQAVFKQRLETLEKTNGIHTSTYYIDPAKDEKIYTLPNRKPK